MFRNREATSEGLERTFAVNHMAYFVVTAILQKGLRATSGARIVGTASEAYKAVRLNFKDLHSQHGYGGFGMYGRSKLMNIPFTRLLARLLARRLAASGVTATCFHPGFVATRFGDAGSGCMNFVLQSAKKFALSCEQGAATLLYLACAPQAAQFTGQHFCECRPAKLMKQARHDADAQRLWEISAELSGVGA